MTNQQIHPLLHEWLSGTTCRRNAKRCILFENSTHIVFKHHGHSEYIDRVRGSGRCGTYAVLYDKRKPNNRLNIGYSYEKKWEGRINLQRIQQDCALLGIHFNEPTLSK